MQQLHSTLPAIVAIAVLLAACGGGENDAESNGGRDDRSERRSDGAEMLWSPPAGESAQNAAFSPDGSTVLFTLFGNGYNRGPARLTVLPADGGEAVTLLEDDDADNVNMPGSSWNATTERVVFASDREGGGTIWTMATDGSDLEKVAAPTSEGSYLQEPTFSPDGAWIVFEDLVSPDDQGTLWKVRADGSERTRLTGEDESRFDDRQANWSPCGDRILFQRREMGADRWRLFTMAPDGSDVRPVATGETEATDASWSPDCQRIVFSGGVDDGLASLFVVPADGGDPVRVTTAGDRYDGAASWSPDSRWIAFESSAGEESPTALWRIATPADPFDPAP